MIYDSLYSDLDSATKRDIQNVFPNSSITDYYFPLVQHQSGIKDCGLFAIAFATTLIFSKDSPQPLQFKFNQEQLHTHLVSCFEKCVISEFP